MRPKGRSKRPQLVLAKKENNNGFVLRCRELHRCIASISKVVYNVMAKSKQKIDGKEGNDTVIGNARNIAATGMAAIWSDAIVCIYHIRPRNIGKG